jgi:hypothetical protein
MTGVFFFFSSLCHESAIFKCQVRLFSCLYELCKIKKKASLNCLQNKEVSCKLGVQNIIKHVYYVKNVTVRVCYDFDINSHYQIIL